MKHWTHNWRFWGLVGVALAVSAGVLVPVLAGRDEPSFTATRYADVVRFEAGDPVASLQVRIYDLSGKELWDSGVVSGRIVDWDRTNEWGERLAYGAYLYQAFGWDAYGVLAFEKSGKLALLPGDKVQLASTPPVTTDGPDVSFLPSDSSLTLAPMAYNATNWWVSGLLGVGTDSPIVGKQLTISAASLAARPGFCLEDRATGDFFQFLLRDTVGDGSGETEARFNIKNVSLNQFFDFMRAVFPDTGPPKVCFPQGYVSIGTTSPTAKLTVVNSTDQPTLRLEASVGTNLIEAYNTGTGAATGLIFRVQRDNGNVYADGAFYGAGFETGAADVAEHINVSEPVEPGDVVEIDPDNPGYFRKARGPHSQLVAGVISTNPGVRLGGAFDPTQEQWDDNRPLLALAGRVPVKVTTENGPIAVGDLLVSSSKPGYAMRCANPRDATGMIIGKALEPLLEGDSMIMAQVMLR